LGWVYVLAEVGPEGLEFRELNLAASFKMLTEALRDVVAINIDMPMGFSANGWREADVLARRFIGNRRSSVFPPPPRALLTAEGGYPELNALAKTMRCGLQKQAYNILPKMREVDAVMTPELQCRVRESHPEVSFCALNGDCLQYSKRTREGRQERLELLTRVFGPIAAEWRLPRGAAMDDLYDAAVLTWTASRVVRDEAVSMPSEPPLDVRGLRMEIVY
jgi:predicted RNase H-like nuclease